MAQTPRLLSAMGVIKVKEQAAGAYWSEVRNPPMLAAQEAQIDPDVSSGGAEGRSNASLEADRYAKDSS